MSIYLGTSEPIAIYKGSQPISAVYVGENKVWPDKHVYTNHIKGTTTGATFIWINEASRLDVPAGDFDVVWTGGAVTDLRLAFSGLEDGTNRHELFTKITLFDVDTSRCNNFAGLCNRCSNLTEFNAQHIDFTSSPNLETIFYNATSLSGLDLSKNIIAGVTSLLGAFAFNRNNIELGKHDWSGVQKMNLAFYDDHNQTSELDFSTLTHECADMSAAFYNCEKVTTIRLGDLSGVTAINNAFYHDYGLVNLTIDQLPNIGLSNWGLEASTLLSHDSLLSVLNALPFGGNAKTCKIGSANLAKLTSEEKAIATNKGWALI